MPPPEPAGVFAAVAATLYAAHALADHWVQTDLQARDKSIPGRIGRLACARHIAAYHLTAAAMLAIAAAPAPGATPRATPPWCAAPARLQRGAAVQLIDDLGSHEPFSETCARRSREAGALSTHARDIAGWLDEHPEILTDSRLRRQRDNLRDAAHTLDDVRQGLRDAARSAAA